MKPAGLARRIVVCLAALVTVVLLLLTARFEAKRRTLLGEIESLKSTRDRWQSLADRLETQRQQGESDRRLTINVLRHARIAEDIADLGGNRVVAVHQGLENLCFYVPEGCHTLEISTIWKPSAPAEHTSDCSWSVPLEPACGYYLTFGSHRQEEPINWTLSSNHPDFPARTEMVAPKGFSQRGSSWSGTEVLAFPNQIERFTTRDLDLSKNHPGLDLLRATRNVAYKGQAYEIAFHVWLLSGGPSCISATDARQVIALGREHLLQPYTGGGKYDLVAPGPSLVPKP